MKIHQLLSGLGIVVTNEEQQFIDKHSGDVRLTALDDHDQWLAQNLVRKGVYSVSNDNRRLIKSINEKNN
jgi:hypothetical protein